MMKQKKRWSEMTTAELAAATKEYDRPNYRPPVHKSSKREMAQLHRIQRRSATNRFRVAMLLEKKLVEQTDNYANDHGVTFSEVVSDALRRLVRKKSA